MHNSSLFLLEALVPPCHRFVFSLWWVVAPLAAQGTSDPTEAFTKVDTMIPMRDGVRLHTSIVVPKADHGSLPSWNDFVAHPNYDAFWQRQAIGPYLSRVTVPTLNVGGWWDQEDFYGPLKIYELSERHDSLTGTSSWSARGTTAGGRAGRATSSATSASA